MTSQKSGAKLLMFQKYLINNFKTIITNSLKCFVSIWRKILKKKTKFDETWRQILYSAMATSDTLDSKCFQNFVLQYIWGKVTGSGCSTQEESYSG